MYSAAELQLMYKFANAPVREFPYPHFYVEDVFPEDFYGSLQANIPDPAAMVPIEEARAIKGYKERFVLEVGKPEHLNALPADKQAFWKDFGGWLCSGRFAGIALRKFQGYIQARFQGQQVPQFYNEALLVQDVTKYALGPHTDALRKVITMLFYLPKDMSQSHLGTSIYLPKDPAFMDPGGPHHTFDRFVRLQTMPFKPNSLFVFFKTSNSFHGVEPVNDPDTRRWLLLFDIYANLATSQPQPAKPAAQTAPANVTFKM